MNYFIFDMDGTIFDTEKIYYQTWLEIAQKNNFTFTLEDKIVLSGRKKDEANLFMMEHFSMDEERVFWII